MSARGLDLTGEWAGMFSYPGALPPVAFRAWLTETGGWISGRIEDADGAPATVQGRRTGLSVSWLKTYARRDVAHDVEYLGAVSADGDEIGGNWSIYGEWSGPFLMVRQPQRALARERQAQSGLTQK